MQTRQQIIAELNSFISKHPLGMDHEVYIKAVLIAQLEVLFDIRDMLSRLVEAGPQSTAGEEGKR